MWQDAEGITRGGMNLKDTMINLSPDASVFIQLIPITRQQEGLPFIPLSADMFQSSGRRQVEALLAEQDPNSEPGTRKNRGVLEADKFSPMTQWSFGFVGKGVVLLDGTKAKERMQRDPITCPNLTNTFETENSTFESRLATCAVGQDTRQACIRVTNEVGREARVHFANINAWFGITSMAWEAQTLSFLTLWLPSCKSMLCGHTSYMWSHLLKTS